MSTISLTIPIHSCSTPTRIRHDPDPKLFGLARDRLILVMRYQYPLRSYWPGSGLTKRNYPHRRAVPRLPPW